MWPLPTWGSTRRTGETGESHLAKEGEAVGRRSVGRGRGVDWIFRPLLEPSWSADRRGGGGGKEVTRPLAGQGRCFPIDGRHRGRFVGGGGSSACDHMFDRHAVLPGLREARPAHSRVGGDGEGGQGPRGPPRAPLPPRLTQPPTARLVAGGGGAHRKRGNERRNGGLRKRGVPCPVAHHFSSAQSFRGGRGGVAAARWGIFRHTTAPPRRRRRVRHTTSVCAALRTVKGAPSPHPPPHSRTPTPSRSPTPPARNSGTPASGTGCARARSRAPARTRRSRQGPVQRGRRSG